VSAACQGEMLEGRARVEYGGQRVLGEEEGGVSWGLGSYIPTDGEACKRETQTATPDAPGPPGEDPLHPPLCMPPLTMDPL
jgi:hypothetical protein